MSMGWSESGLRFARSNVRARWIPAIACTAGCHLGRETRWRNIQGYKVGQRLQSWLSHRMSCAPDACISRAKFPMHGKMQPSNHLPVREAGCTYPVLGPPRNDLSNYRPCKFTLLPSYQSPIRRAICSIQVLSQASALQPVSAAVGAAVATASHSRFWHLMRQAKFPTHQHQPYSTSRGSPK